MDPEADTLRIALRDMDAPTAAHEYFYQFDLTGVPAGGQFHSLCTPIPDWPFLLAASGLNPGDGVLDPGLGRIIIESVFGSTEALRVEVDHATTRAASVPRL